MTITPGIDGFGEYGNPLGTVSGSWFAMHMDSIYKITGLEKTSIYPGADGGIAVGTSQQPGQIDSYTFLGVPGRHSAMAPSTGGTTFGIDFSGWTVSLYGDSMPSRFVRGVGVLLAALPRVYVLQGLYP